MKSWTCELVIKHPGGRDIVAELGHEMLRVIAGSIADDIDNLELLSALASHPSGAIRAEVARRDCLDGNAVAHLLDDQTPAVRQALIWSAACRDRLSQEWVLAAIERDPALAEEIVGEIDEFSALDAVTVLAQLADHRDPVVRSAVARSRGGGRAVLRRLSKDADPDVRSNALSTLSDW